MFMKRTTVLLAVILAGCGDDGFWQDTQVPDGTSLGMYCDELGASACRRAGECGDADFGSCVRQFKTECCAGIGTCAKSAPAAAVAELAARCVPAYAVLTCEESRAHAVPASCQGYR